MEKEILSTKVTRIGKKFHCRLYNKETILDEMACNSKKDIGFCIAYMLKWYDKLGGNSQMAMKSRSRQRSKSSETFGKIWYKKDLEK